jgi:hypothetical protein
LVVTRFVFTVNVAVAAFAATVILEGTVAAGSLLVILTAAPPLGAVPSRVTVAVACAPLVTLAGVTDKELIPTDTEKVITKSSELALPVPS